jgi:hypothetical protein
VDKERALDYINRLDQFDEIELAKVATSEN